MAMLVTQRERRYGPVVLAIFAMVAGCERKADGPTAYRGVPDSEVAPEAVGRFFETNPVDETDLSIVWFRDEGNDFLEMRTKDQLDVLKSIKKDTQPFPGDDSFVYSGSYSVVCWIIVNGRADALVLYVDPYGFSLGQGGRCRFVNPSLATSLRRVFRENGLLDADDGPWLESMLLKGAGRLGADVDVDPRITAEGLQKLLRDRGTDPDK